jgi:hypothetical protein
MGADHLARVIDQVFQEPPTPAESQADHTTLLEGLQAGVAARVAVLEAMGAQERWSILEEVDPSTVLRSPRHCGPEPNVTCPHDAASTPVRALWWRPRSLVGSLLARVGSA